MRTPGRSIVSTALLLGAALPCRSQSSADLPPLAPVRQFHVDLNIAGIGVGHSVRNSARTSFGVSVGVGGNWYSHMLFAGRHFAESNGLSYEDKDGATGKSVIELFSASVFVRRHFASGRQLDVALKGSGFLHSDSSDDDPGGGTFAGLGVTGMWYKWRRIRFGSQLDVGRYSEGTSELGVNFAPILVRVTFP